MSSPGRRWLEVRVQAPADDERAALVAGALVALGGRAVQEVEGAFVTHLPEPRAAAMPSRLEADLRRATGLERLSVTVAVREHEAWEETWRRGLAPRRIGERILVTPSWARPPARPGDVVVVLDPGMAFGTAEHGTTRGCLRLLQRVLAQGDEVLDVGAGSGILAIAAARLGAGRVLALEGDPLAVEVLAENVARNQVSDRVAWREVWVDEPLLRTLGRPDGIVANLETGKLRPLLAGMAGALPSGGWLIVSGILDHEWPSLEAEAASHGLRTVAVDADGAWRSAHLEPVATEPAV